MENSIEGLEDKLRRFHRKKKKVRRKTQKMEKKGKLEKQYMKSNIKQ